MAYISPANEYPRHIGDIQLEHPDFTESDALPAGWAEVVETEAPTRLTDELVYEGEPVEIKGVWTQTWIQRPMTLEEIARRDAPITAKAKLMALGLTAEEISAITR